MRKMKVAVMTANGDAVHTTGDFDERRIDGIYGRVNEEIYPIAYIIPVEKVENYLKEIRVLMEQAEKIETEIYKLRADAHV